MMPTVMGTVFTSDELDGDKEASEVPFDENDDDYKLQQLEKIGKYIIFEAEAVSLFGVFKGNDKITICTNRVAITRQTWFSNTEKPMTIESITGASVFRHLMYASLSITTFGIQKPEPLTRLRIHDARLARRYILALVECKKAGIDLTKFDLEELKERLKNLGVVRYSHEENYHRI